MDVSSGIRRYRKYKYSGQNRQTIETELFTTLPGATNEELKKNLKQ